MPIDQYEVSTSFMIGPLLFVVDKRGNVWKFLGWDNWMRVITLPIT
jgi:hypothetical protein